MHTCKLITPVKTPVASRLIYRSMAHCIALPLALLFTQSIIDADCICTVRGMSNEACAKVYRAVIISSTISHI
jgi:hypothetical protein